MRRNNLKTKLGWTVMVIGLVAGSVGGCISTDDEKDAIRRFISAALARRIDEQLGPVDTSDPVGGPLSHLGNNLEGTADLNTLLTYLRLAEDISLQGMNAVGQGTLAAVGNLALAAPLAPASVDNNPCTQDLDNDGNLDYTDLCLGRELEIACVVDTPNHFRMIYSDCRNPDSAYRRFLVTTTTSSWLTTTSSPSSGTVIDTSTAYWLTNGAVKFHYGVGGVDEQTVLVSYRPFNRVLQDFQQTAFHALWDLDNAIVRLRGEQLIYRVIQPNGLPATGTTFGPDGMVISHLEVEVDDDGELTDQAMGQYKLFTANDWEDGLAFLEQDRVVLPPRPAFPVVSNGPDSYLFTFFDQTFPWNDGLGTGCQVEVTDVNPANRTFNIADPTLLVSPCPGIEADSGVEY